MKNRIIYFSLILTLILYNGCKYNSYGLEEFLHRDGTIEKRTQCMEEITEDFKVFVPAFKTDENAPSEYTVAVITDVHFGGESDGKNPDRHDQDFFTWIESLEKKPAFCICLGDIAEHGYESEFVSYCAFTDRLDTDYSIKTFNAVGNHDLYNSGWTYYEKKIYPNKSFYHFNTPNFSWYFIDSASGSLGNKQYMQLCRALKNDPLPKIVSSHYPLYVKDLIYFCMQNSTERNLLISCFAKYNVKMVLSGHIHKQNTSDFGKFVEETIPGFLEKNSWGLITVNETAGTVSCSIIRGASF